MVRIFIGSLTDPAYLFEDEQIYSCSSDQGIALVGQELRIDTLEVVVKDSDENTRDVEHFVSSDGVEIKLGTGEIYAVSVGDVHASALIDLDYGTPVWYYSDEELPGKFYVADVKREGKNKYRISCVSSIGILDKMMHSGGLFLSSTFSDVLQNIMSN